MGNDEIEKAYWYVRYDTPYRTTWSFNRYEDQEQAIEDADKMSTHYQVIQTQAIRLDYRKAIEMGIDVESCYVSETRREIDHDE